MLLETIFKVKEAIKMKATYFVKLMILVIVAVPLAGDVPGQGKKPTQERGRVTQQQDRDRTQDRDRDRDMDQDQDRDRDRIRLNDTQGEQLRDRIRATDQTRDQMRTMLRDYDNAGLTAAQGQEHQIRIREQFRNMEQEHQQFMNGMDNEQRDRWRNRVMTMEQQQAKIANRLQLMEQEMNNGQFDRIRQRNWVRENERAMKEWREQYHKIQHEGTGN